ncbi:hypothetical protein V496_01284 [Pseudogymnoascus sp. VKM F-4515 (FW-2607)]|nr:hypothetical protein V496_01284 [Pseudogymnoascus sp. VKM F-4515 (FW-2607)]
MSPTMPAFISRLIRPFTSSASLAITPPGPIPATAQKATLAAGCFWGVEHMFHAEAVQLTFDPATLPYTTILDFFYRIHDPTTRDAQGPDIGSQYRSGIFFHSEEQEKQAREVTEKASKQWWGGKVVTQILPAGEWWDAEDYHQRYLDVHENGYQCSSHILRKFPDLQ